MAVLTLESKPYTYSNTLIAVSALLLVVHSKNVINREYPSIGPCSTKPYRIKLWWLSMCHKLFGAGTLHFFLLIILKTNASDNHQDRNEQDFLLEASAEHLFLKNSNVLKSWSDRTQNHVYFDNPESNCPIHHQRFYWTLLNLLFHNLALFISKSIPRLVAYLQLHSRQKQAIQNTVSVLLEFQTLVYMVHYESSRNCACNYSNTRFTSFSLTTKILIKHIKKIFKRLQMLPAFTIHNL